LPEGGDLRQGKVLVRSRADRSVLIPAPGSKVNSVTGSAVGLHISSVESSMPISSWFSLSSRLKSGNRSWAERKSTGAVFGPIFRKLLQRVADEPETNGIPPTIRMNAVWKAYVKAPYSKSTSGLKRKVLLKRLICPGAIPIQSGHLFRRLAESAGPMSLTMQSIANRIFSAWPRSHRLILDFEKPAE